MSEKQIEDGEKEVKDGGPAFPFGISHIPDQGLTKRDYFAVHVGHPDIEGVTQCDDQDLLERFGTQEERDEGFRLALPEKQWMSNIELRQKLEARARAYLRYLEADAMLKARRVES